MRRFLHCLSAGALVLSACTATALAQQPTPGRMADLVHDGWYFRGNSPTDSEARIGGPNATALVVDCNGTVPRVIVFLQEAGVPYGITTASQPTGVTFRFTKRSVASIVTSRFDTEQSLQVPGQQISAGLPDRPPISQHVNIDGAAATKVIALMQSMDHVSISAVGLGQPLQFELRGAGPAIDQLTAVCSKP
jgi:hypothetical protein